MLVDGLPACYFPAHFGEDSKVRAAILRMFGAIAMAVALCSAFALRGTCAAALPFKLVRAESLSVEHQLHSRGGSDTGGGSAYQVVPDAARYSVSTGLSYQDAVAGAQAPEDTGSVI